MALFPKCKFTVLLPHGTVIPGRKLEGTLVIEAPEAIPRAEHVDLVFRSGAWAGYGSGKSRSVVRRDMFIAPMHVDLPRHELPAGTHRYPFALDVPAWLPPELPGPDCGLFHRIEVRLDVDWAIDPTAQLAPVVVMAPREGVRTPLNVRSPQGFHESIVLDVTLDSNVIAQGEELRGQIALRSGRDARFDAAVLSLMSLSTITMGRGDRRYGGGSTIRIPAEKLRSGEAVPFVFPPDPHVPPTFRNSFIEHDAMLRVSVDIPWAFDPYFELTLLQLPAGSTLYGEGGPAIVGGERLRQIASVMAQSTGLRVGRPPVLVEGAAGPVALRITDAPRGGAIGIDADLTFPDTELGISFRPLGMLEGFRDSPLLPAALRDRYLLRASPHDERPKVEDAVLGAFFEAVLGDLATATEVRLNDHHLGVHFPLQNDGGDRMIEVARFVQNKANMVAAAIARLPFPYGVAASRPAWEAVAAEQSAALVPSGPSLHGLVFRARVFGGEERAVTASIRTVWKKEGSITHVDVDLSNAPLPKNAIAELESGAGSERLRAVRAAFPSAHANGDGRAATLERDGFAADPRALLPGIETFFDWVLDARGERRSDMPYR